MIDMSEIGKILDSVGANIEIPENILDFNRNIDFNIRGKDYRICWFCNESTLMTKDKELYYPFNKIEIDTIYPREGKFLKFYSGENNWEAVRIKIKDTK